MGEIKGKPPDDRDRSSEELADSYIVGDLIPEDSDLMNEDLVRELLKETTISQWMTPINP